MERGMNLLSMTQGRSQLEYPREQIFEDMSRCKPHIDAALEHTHSGDGRVTHTFQDIVEGVTRGQYQFWPGERSCMVTELIIYPQRKGVNVFLAGGDLDEILEMEKDLTEWAKIIGADHLSLTGRTGWTRALKEAGWGHPMVCLTKEITDGQK
jgi:hypothetical protein